MKLSHRDQLIALGVVIALLVVATVFLLIMPQRKNIKRLDTEIAQAKTEIASAKSLVGRRQDAKRDAAATEAELLRLANAIPESPEIPSLIIELQDTANDAGLELVKIAPKADLDDMDGYRSASVGLLVRGAWADVVHYLQRIQKLNREIRVVDGVVSPVTDLDVPLAPDDDPPLEVNITVRVYTMGAGGAAPAIPGAPTASAVGN